MMRIDDTALRVPPTAANPDLVRFLRFAKFVETGLYETNEAIDILTRNISALQGEKMPPAPAIEKVKAPNYATSFAIGLGVVGTICGFLFEYQLEWNKVDGLNVIFWLMAAVFCAAIGAGIFAAVGAIIGAVASGIAAEKLRSKASEKHDAEMKEYNRQVTEKQTHIDKTIRELQDELNKLKEARSIIQEIRDYLYSSEVLYKTYQNLTAVCQLLEYFEAGRFQTLGDAYNQYELEVRLDRIITDLHLVLERLDQIRENQLLLYEAVIDVRSDINALNMTMNTAVSKLNSIEVSQKVTAIATSLTAVASFMTYSIERKQLKNMPTNRDVSAIRRKIEDLNKKLV